MGILRNTGNNWEVLEIFQELGDQEAVEAFFARHHGYSAIRKAQIHQTLDAGELNKSRPR